MLSWEEEDLFVASSLVCQLSSQGGEGKGGGGTRKHVSPFFARGFCRTVIFKLLAFGVVQPIRYLEKCQKMRALFWFETFQIDQGMGSNASQIGKVHFTPGENALLDITCQLIKIPVWL